MAFDFDPDGVFVSILWPIPLMQPLVHCSVPIGGEFLSNTLRRTCSVNFGTRIRGRKCHICDIATYRSECKRNPIIGYRSNSRIFGHGMSRSRPRFLGRGRRLGWKCEVLCGRRLVDKLGIQRRSLIGFNSFDHLSFASFTFDKLITAFFGSD